MLKYKKLPFFYRNNKQGFTLLELIVVITIIALIAGTLAPAGVLAINIQRRVLTEKRMEDIHLAIRSYFEDVREFPFTLDDLFQNPGDAAWKGPYITPIIRGGEDTTNTVTHDAFGSPYDLELGVLDASLTSFGANKQDDNGTEDDIVMFIDMTEFLKAETKLEIGILNRAAAMYEALSAQEVAQDPEEGEAFPKLKNGDYEFNLFDKGLIPDPLSVEGIDVITDEFGEKYTIKGNKFASDSVGK